jgi:hypothetical protein
MHNEQIQRKLADFYKQSILQEWNLFKLEEKSSTNEARLEKRCRKEKLLVQYGSAHGNFIS